MRGTPQLSKVPKEEPGAGKQPYRRYTHLQGILVLLSGRKASEGCQL